MSRALSGPDPTQYRVEVVRPALRHVGLWNAAAENLVVGTALKESLLRFVRQIKGPALGLHQMERATHDDIHRTYLTRPANKRLRRGVLELARYFCGDWPDASELCGNMYYAAAMCRVHYLRVEEILPADDDAEGLARYWKHYYNTPAGRGDVLEALPHFQFAVSEGPQ